MKIYSNIYIPQTNRSAISNTNFKGEFDKYAFISQKIVNAKIAKQRSKHESSISSYNTQISHVDNQLSSLKAQIKNLRRKIDKNDSLLESLRAEGNEIITEVQDKKELVKNLSENNPQLIQQYYGLKDDIQSDIKNKTASEIIAISNETQKQCQLMDTGLKNQLIKKVINPILQYNNIPASVYIENTSGTNNLEDRIATWLCSMANASNKKMDASLAETPVAFINNIKKLLLSAYRNFEENGNWTMIFINNINSLNLNEINKISPNFLNEILKSCNKLYHSSIVAISNHPFESVIPKLNFTEYLTLDKTFIQDSNVGLISLTKDLIKKKI